MEDFDKLKVQKDAIVERENAEAISAALDGLDQIAQDALAFAAQQIKAKDAEIARLQAEIAMLKGDESAVHQGALAALSAVKQIGTLKQRAQSAESRVMVLREALEQSELAWSMVETAAATSNTYQIPIGDVAKLRAKTAGEAIRAALAQTEEENA